MSKPSRILGVGLLCTLIAACSGGSSSPTSPEPLSAASTVRTTWGSITVYPNGCGTADLDQIARSVTEGYDQAREEVGSKADSVLLNGLTMHGDPNLECAGTSAYGCYYFDKDAVYYRCGSENVIRHELQHRFCDRLNCPCDCYMVNHAGGTDLACQPI